MEHGCGEPRIQQGGVYAVTLTVTDDDTGRSVSTTLAVITGAGVNEGVLEIVGSNTSDMVTVSNGESGYEVDASFFAGGAALAVLDPPALRLSKCGLAEGNDRVDLYGLRTFEGWVLARWGRQRCIDR